MIALLNRYRVALKSPSIDFTGLIRECLEVDAIDEVEAAHQAKKLTALKHKGRPASSWQTVSVIEII